MTHEQQHKKPFVKKSIDNYFQNQVLNKQEADELGKEIRLQNLSYRKGVSKKELFTLFDECSDQWRKYLNTTKMREGQKISHASYQICMNNLDKIRAQG